MWSLDDMMGIRSSKRGDAQAGDTIVEVLIIIGVVAFALVGTYSVVQRNIRSMQETQESAQAQKITQDQVELLRIAEEKPTLINPSCYVIDSGIVLIKSDTDILCEQTIGGATYKRSITVNSDAYVVNTTWDTLGGKEATVTIYYRI